MIDSPSSAESSFRELDDVFLQTQTRIWLGEVLSTRLDEDLHISHLLQDGEILFEVSKVVWNKLLTKCMELRHLKHKYRPFGSKKSSGRYRPYSNVDSFLKVCKILGLSGIDLFSPSDVVEKRDTRKVCICIRALSKKARSKQLSVPDFDLVIYSVAMPTVMVGGIRRSLESSQWTLSSSSSYSSQKGPRMKLKQKNLSTPSGRDEDSSSEVSDEAESRYMGENCGENSDQEDSPEARSIFDVSHITREDRYNCRNGTVNVPGTDFTFENDDSVVGDSSCINIGESNYISDYLAFSDLMVHATDGNNPVILDGEKNMFDFFLNVDSQKLGSDEKGSQRKFSDDEDMEVSSVTSMSSVLGRLLNLEFDDQIDAEELSSANVYCSLSMEHEDGKHYNETELLERELCKTQPSNLENAFNLDNETLLCEDNENETVSATTLGSKSDLSLHRDDPASTDMGSLFSDVTSDRLNFSCNDKPDVESEILSEQHHQNINVRGFSIGETYQVVSDEAKIHRSVVQENMSETISENHSCLPPAKDINRVRDDDHVADVNKDDISSAGEKDKREHVPMKHGKRPLLKTVIKGTAIAGVLFLLLQIRKSRGNNAQESKQYTYFSRYNGSKSSSTKQQTGSRGKRIYPAEKIKLGN
ncbi:hypothetical protein BUALT_Bualt04G0063300 [Buddleja alternifolia]|uniref:Calponin-homology (CH) domain-containing protein n=1 Tax=Buddleja alternifolia TaxID=168488 RepID=A0AAV6XTH9_9LAMI|nr:hypothetical protein BUALT_Bualt04G0063300 [Buddleja alternifolia]